MDKCGRKGVLDKTLCFLLTNYFSQSSVFLTSELLFQLTKSQLLQLVF